MLFRLSNVSWDIRILQEKFVYLRMGIYKKKHVLQYFVFLIDDALNDKQIFIYLSQ